MTSITETPNPLSRNIDTCSSQQILDILQCVDNEMFATDNSQKLLHSNKHMQHMIERCSVRVGQLIKENVEHIVNSTMSYHDGEALNQERSSQGTVAFAGCGTSGRLSYFCAKSYNQCLNYILSHKYDSSIADQQPVTLFKYLLAGGYAALVKAVESAEDSAEAAIQDFKSLVSDNKEEQIVYVGITCGMSAPYIAGQLYYTIQQKENKNMSSVLLGFNPVELARKTAIENWSVSATNDGEPMNFYKIAKQIEHLSTITQDQFTILNPIVGPEGVTGSTRMKGGSATKFLLDTIFASAAVTELSSTKMNREQIIYRLLNGFQQTMQYTYQYAQHHAQISGLIDRAAHTLRSGNGSIYYLGAGNAGMVGFIDASECGPTYGAKLTDVRGYIVNGWRSVFGEKKYSQIHPRMEDQGGDEFKIDIADFEERVLPNLNANDTIIFLHISKDCHTTEHEQLQLVNLVNRIASEKTEVHVSWLSIDALNPENSCMFPLVEDKISSNDHLSSLPDSVNRVSILIPYMSLIPGLNGFAELSLKLVLNAVTTGAHVLKGTIYGNRMINLRVSNNKLFYRAIGIVSSIMNVEEGVARQCLLRSIYRIEDAVEKFGNDPISKHIEAAIKTDRVVPVALLLASDTSATVEQAIQVLQQEPIIRNAIAKIGRK